MTSLQTRKIARDRIRAILADDSTGFNVRMAAISGDYGVTVPAIDWFPTSKSVYFGYIDPQDIGKTQLQIDGGDPQRGTLCLAIYTSDAENQHIEKPLTFSGIITAHCDFYLYRRTGINVEIDDVESYADAIEDACTSCLESGDAAWSPSVSYMTYRSTRQPVELLPDGFRRVIPIEMSLRVRA